jgi:hypothetical protein
MEYPNIPVHAGKNTDLATTLHHAPDNENGDYLDGANL